jgi:quercetin dioxygenase-like cupin family protein
MPLSDPILTPPNSGDTSSYGQGSGARLLAGGPQTGGDYGVVLYRVKAGDEPPYHTHTREDETVYLLKGEITAYLGGQKIEVPEGSYAALPKGVPHGFRVRGDEATLLISLHPAGAERFFVPAPGSGEPDPADFGLEMLGDLPE